MARGQGRQFAEQVTQGVWNQSTHKILVTVVHEPMQQEGVALREDRLGQLGWPLRRQDQAETELPALPRDALERLATQVATGGHLAGVGLASDEVVRLLQDEDGRKFGTRKASGVLQAFHDDTSQD